IPKTSTCNLAVVSCARRTAPDSPNTKTIRINALLFGATLRQSASTSRIESTELTDDRDRNPDVCWLCEMSEVSRRIIDFPSPLASSKIGLDLQHRCANARKLGWVVTPSPLQANNSEPRPESADVREVRRSAVSTMNFRP